MFVIKKQLASQEKKSSADGEVHGHNIIATGRWFSPGTPFPPPIKLTATIYLVTEILLKVG